MVLAYLQTFSKLEDRTNQLFFNGKKLEAFCLDLERKEFSMNLNCSSLEVVNKSVVA